MPVAKSERDSLPSDRQRRAPQNVEHPKSVGDFIEVHPNAPASDQLRFDVPPVSVVGEEPRPAFGFEEVSIFSSI